MVVYDLDSNSPNQTFSIVQSGHRIDITLQTAYDILFASTKIDGNAIANSVRCVNNQRIIPYQAYIPEGVGNIFFYCKTDDYPSFVDFNKSCILVYLTPTEMKELGLNGRR